jgi:flagellar biosynthesis/type III secretory pathway chaperone
MENQVEDQPVLNHIQQLVEEEHRLYLQGELPQADLTRLEKVKIELDQCWDLLRQRRALRDFGLDPNKAEVRPPQVVENYEQ